MIRIQETIVVEGRYDINALKQCVDAHIIETSGFGIFNNKEKMHLIRLLAEKNGVIVLTDSDGAGLVIRNHLRGCIKKGTVKHAYIPDIEGKERRKTTASKAGLLGVEGMSSEIIVNSLLRAGATVFGGENKCGNEMSKTDFYEFGLSGGKNSAERRKRVATILGFPSEMSANALFAALNAMFTSEEFCEFMKENEI